MVVAMVFTSKERRVLVVMCAGSRACIIKDVVESNGAIFSVPAEEQQVKAEGNIWARTALRETPEPAREFQFLPRSHFASCPAAATSKQPHNPEHLTTQTIAIQAQVCHQTPIPPPASDSLVRLTSSTPPPSPSAPVKLTSPNARVPHLSSLRAVKIINNSPATTQPRRSHPPLRSAPSQTRHRASPYPSHPSPPALKDPPSTELRNIQEQTPGKHTSPGYTTDSAR